MKAGGSGQDVLDIATEWAVSNRAFRRNRVDARKKVLAAILARSGISYREVASLIGGMSYIAVRDCYLSVERLLPGERTQRGTIALDETETRIAGKLAYLWLARDIGTGQTISFQCSFAGSPEDSALFAQSVLERCSNRPRARLGAGENHPRALKNIELYFETDRGSGVVKKIRSVFSKLSLRNMEDGRTDSAPSRT